MQFIMFLCVDYMPVKQEKNQKYMFVAPLEKSAECENSTMTQQQQKKHDVHLVLAWAYDMVPLYLICKFYILCLASEPMTSTCLFLMKTGEVYIKTWY